MIQGAFSRSNAVRAIVRNDISPAMANWWKVQKKDDGVVSGMEYRLDFESDVTDIIYYRLVGICPLTKFNL